MTNITFDDDTIKALKNTLGVTLKRYSCDPFIYSDAVFGMVGFQIGNRYYKLTAELKPVQRFFARDDVAILQFCECDPEDIKSRMDNGTLIDTPINDCIIGIDIINDYESVFHNAEREDLYSTKGLIIYFSSGNELSFEIGSWFSEMITVRRGYGLIKDFTPINDFIVDEWGNNDGYKAECDRKVISLQVSRDATLFQ